MHATGYEGDNVPTAGSPSILSIDLGTSAVKLALITTRGVILGGEEEPIPLSLLPEGGAEQDPESWWSAIVRATRRLLERGVAPLGDIIGVNVGSQWSGTVAVDEQGRPLRPAILWMDSRGARHIQRVTRGLVSFEGYGVGKAAHLGAAHGRCAQHVRARIPSGTSSTSSTSTQRCTGTRTSSSSRRTGSTCG